MTMAQWLLLISASILSILWVFNPAGHYEPAIVACTSLLAIIMIAKSRFRRPTPNQMETPQLDRDSPEPHERLMNDFPKDPTKLLTVSKVEKILNAQLPEENKDPSDQENYLRLIQHLNYFGITTEDELQNLLREHRADIDAAEEDAIRSIAHHGAANPREQYAYDNSVYFTHYEMVQLALQGQFGTKWEYYIKTLNEYEEKPSSTSS